MAEAGLKQRMKNSAKKNAALYLDIPEKMIEEDLIEFMTTNGDAILRARAGSGKTTALAMKTAWLVSEKNVDPTSIMLLAFNNAAARGIEKRISDLGVGVGEGGVRVRTFHALGQRIVRSHFGKSRECVFDEEGENGKRVKEILNESMDEVLNERFYISCASKMRTHYGKRKEYVESIARETLAGVVAFLRARGYGAQQKLENAWELGGPIAANAMKVIYGFERRMREEGLLDATGVLQAAAWTLEREIEKGWRKDSDAHDVLWLFLDEFQDVSKPYMRLVEAIRRINGGVNVQCVGDDWQAINGFAGADLTYFSRPEEFLEDPKNLTLLRNRRSGSSIVEWGNAVMIDAGDNGPPAKSYPGNGQGIVRESRVSPRDITLLSHGLAKVVDPSMKSVALIARRWKVGDHHLSRVSTMVDEILKQNGVNIKVTGITAHGSKGLEYDQVLLLDDGSFPMHHPSRPIVSLLIPESEWMREEACLKYVGGTRARKILDIIDCKQSK